MYTTKVGIVDNDMMMNSLLSFLLFMAGYEIQSFCSIEETKTASKTEIDLWLIHVQEQWILDEIKTLILFKEELHPVPVCFLSVKGGELEQLIGFEGSCDYYVSKPFSRKELLLRVQYLISKANNTLPLDMSSLIQIHDYILDPHMRRITRYEQPVALSEKEYELFMLLISHRNETVEKAVLFQSLWNQMKKRKIHILEDTISRLRKKLPGIEIKTVYGVGYRIDLEI